MAGSPKLSSSFIVLFLTLAAPARAQPGKAEKNGPLKGTIAAFPRTGKLEGRSLFIDGRETAVRQDRFSAKRAGGRYDAWLVDKAKQGVTIYQGLTRRDPVLRVKGNGQSPPEEHKTELHGLIRGEFPFPVDDNRGLNVYFLAKEVQAFWQAHPVDWSYGRSAGPRFGRMRVHWSGPRTIVGDLYAVGAVSAEKKRWSESWLAHAEVQLSDGAEAYQELTMKPVPVGRIAGAVSIVGKDMVREMGFYYQRRGKPGRITLGGCPVLNTYDCRLPDLGSLGGEYCAHINYQFPSRYRANGTSTRCGGKLGMTDFSFHVAAEPQWVGVGNTVSMNPKTVLRWQDQSPGVYEVALSPSWDSGLRGPAVTIYTGQTSVAWPDLSAVGVAFPAGATYDVKVTRLSPCASVDEFASARGFDKSGDYEEAETELKLKMEKP